MTMFIWTAKINKKRIRLLLTLAVVFCTCSGAAALLGARQAGAASPASPKGVKTAADRAAYLRSWGWQVEEEPSLVEELGLPKELGAEYAAYLELQTGQGFDLAKYAGKRVKRFTYQVLNHPSGEEGVVAHLLMYKNTVIGGEIMGKSFLHGLAQPE